MRVVLDVNVLVSGLLSGSGAPSDTLRAWLAGRFELVISAELLTELERTLAYPKIRKRVTPDEAARFVDLLRRTATLAADRAPDPRFRSEDPDDDYLVGLAAAERALLVSGDRHVLALADRLVPVYSVREFVELLAQ